MRLCVSISDGLLDWSRTHADPIRIVVGTSRRSERSGSGPKRSGIDAAHLSSKMPNSRWPNALLLRGSVSPSWKPPLGRVRAWLSQRALPNVSCERCDGPDALLMTREA